jgi:hypothetical protein
MNRLEAALVELNALIEKGGEFPDASYRVAMKYVVSLEKLTEAYDNQFAR